MQGLMLALKATDRHIESVQHELGGRGRKEEDDVAVMLTRERKIMPFCSAKPWQTLA